MHPYCHFFLRRQIAPQHRHFFSSDNCVNNTNYCVVVLKCLALSTTLILANWTELNSRPPNLEPHVYVNFVALWGTTASPVVVDLDGISPFLRRLDVLYNVLNFSSYVHDVATRIANLQNVKKIGHRVVPNTSYSYYWDKCKKNCSSSLTHDGEMTGSDKVPWWMLLVNDDIKRLGYLSCCEQKYYKALWSSKRYERGNLVA